MLWPALLLTTMVAPLQQTPPVAHVVDSIFNAELQQKRFRNAAFVLVSRDGFLLSRGYGSVTPKRNVAPDPRRTVYRIASNSKLLVATAAMQMVEAGRLDLNANINQYLKFHLDTAYGAVNTASLLTHTSGIENRMIGALARDSSELVPMGDFFARGPPHVDAPPGSRITYSNIGMALAAHVVEAVSGEPFYEYAERHLLLPLGMMHSSFRQPTPTALSAAMPAPTRKGTPPLFQPYAAGSLVATPEDMGRFIIAQLNGGTVNGGRILSAEAVHELQRTHWRPAGDVQGVAYGFFETWMNGERGLFHTGSSGHHSLVFVLPDRGVGFFAVYDTDDANALAMMERLTHAFMDAQFPEARANQAALPATASVEDFDRLVGTYQTNAANPHTIEKPLALTIEVVVTESNDSLFFKVPGAPPLSSKVIGPGVFKLEDGGIVAFDVGKNGSARGFTLVGSIWDPQGFHRVSWYHSASFAIAAAILLIGALIIRALIGVVLWRRQRRSGAAATFESRLSRLGWKLSIIPLYMLVVAPPLIIISVITSPKPITGLPWGVAPALTLVSFSALIALILPFAVVDAWRTHSWSIGRRAFFSVLALAGVIAAFVLYDWNLVGWHY